MAIIGSTLPLKPTQCGIGPTFKLTLRGDCPGCGNALIMPRKWYVYVVPGSVVADWLGVECLDWHPLISAASAMNKTGLYRIFTDDPFKF